MKLPKIFYGNNSGYIFEDVIKKIVEIFPEISFEDALDITSHISKLPTSVLIINGEENGIKVGDLETVKDFCSTSFLNTKVCFIHKIDNATIEFQNGILKLLEETNIIFFLSANSITRILKTIISRSILEVTNESTFDPIKKLVNLAKSYNIETTEDEILNIKENIINMGFIWAASKTERKNLPKYIIIWEHILLNDINLQGLERKKKYAHNLVLCDNYLNRFASNLISKNSLEMLFFSNIEKT